MLEHIDSIVHILHHNDVLLLIRHGAAEFTIGVWMKHKTLQGTDVLTCCYGIPCCNERLRVIDANPLSIELKPSLLEQLLLPRILPLIQGCSI